MKSTPEPPEVRDPHTGPEHHAIEIIINGDTYTAPERKMTGAQIKTLGHVPEAETLFIVHGKGHEKRVENDEIVELHGREVFESGPDGGVS